MVKKRCTYSLVLALLVFGAPGLLNAKSSDISPADDWRLARKLEAGAYGSPRLASRPGPQGELMLAAVALAGSGSQETARLERDDYDALLALLQRYRDQLVGLGLDYDQLVARVETFAQQAEGMHKRLDDLHPRDGMKIHGRLVSSFDYLHITGPLALTGPVAKPPNKGILFQQGVNRADLEFTLTRGLVSALAEFDMVSAWGAGTASFNARRLYIEVRLPVAFQFGHLDSRLTPLTLWRNGDSYPFEPEPFKGRRKRIQRDYQLEDSRWRLTGARFSTDLRLFDSFSLEMESLTALVAHPFLTASPLFHYQFPPNFDQLVSLHTTWLEAWRAAVPMPFGLTAAYNGIVFKDVPDSRPNSGYTGMTELVQSGQLSLDKGIFFADAEFALSSFDPNSLTYTARPASLTGTAFTGLVGVKGKLGKLEVFGRAVSAGFHAAGAQGRTQDANFEFLGPLQTEISSINAGGGIGIGQLPVPPQQQWNKNLIPPGVFVKLNLPTPVLAPAGDFGHLLPYNALQMATPYGKATPNRQGFGATGELHLLEGMIKPMAGFESLQHQDTVTDSVTNTWGAQADPFTFTALRVGIEVNIWKVTLTGGYTAGKAANGQDSPALDLSGNALPYELNTALLEAGMVLKPIEDLALQAGWRHFDFNGLSYDMWVTLGKGAVFDQLGFGIEWNITDDARVNVLWDRLTLTAPDTPGFEFTADTIYARMVVEF